MTANQGIKCYYGLKIILINNFLTDGNANNHLWWTSLLIKNMSLFYTATGPTRTRFYFNYSNCLENRYRSEQESFHYYPWVLSHEFP